MSDTQTNKTWGGRFTESTDAFVAAFTASVRFDRRMYRQDIDGSIAHARMLARTGVLAPADCEAIVGGLEAIRGEIERGEFEWSVGLEDVHMNIEARPVSYTHLDVYKRQFLRQFMYTKFVIVVDEDVNARDWKDVIWAMTTRMDPARDTVTIENTPIDYLDFASPVSGLGSKIGFDATNKWPGETTRQWGRPLTMSDAVKRRVDTLWAELGL